MVTTAVFLVSIQLVRFLDDFCCIQYGGKKKKKNNNNKRK